MADDAEIECSLYGGTGVNSAHPYHIDEWPHRLEAGTQNLGGIAGLNAAQDCLAEKGIENIYKHEIGLLERLMAGLSEIKGVKISGHTRTGLECAPLIHKHIGTYPKDTVRFSIGPFNTEAHIEHAIKSVAEITKQATGKDPVPRCS